MPTWSWQHRVIALPSHWSPAEPLGFNGMSASQRCKATLIPAEQKIEQCVVHLYIAFSWRVLACLVKFPFLVLGMLCQSVTHFSAEIFQQLFNGLPWNCVQTSSVPRQWSLLTLVIPWLFLKCHCYIVDFGLDFGLDVFRTIGWIANL